MRKFHLFAEANREEVCGSPKSKHQTVTFERGRPDPKNPSLDARKRKKITKQPRMFFDFSSLFEVGEKGWETLGFWV